MGTTFFLSKLEIFRANVLEQKNPISPDSGSPVSGKVQEEEVKLQSLLRNELNSGLLEDRKI